MNKTLYMSDLPKLSLVWFTRSEDGSISSALNLSKADDGKFYTMVSRHFRECEEWGVCETALNRAGYVLSFVADVGFHPDSVYELVPIETKDNARECGRRAGDALPGAGCGGMI